MTLLRSRSIRPQRERRRVAAVIGGTALVAAALVGTGGATAQGAVALPAECSQAGTTVTCTYDAAGALRSFTVPVGVTSIAVTVTGGSGGRGDGTGGGAGAVVKAGLAVTSGQVLWTLPGGSARFGPGTTCLTGIQCVGGVNGGGTGHAGGGGGGASELRVGGNNAGNRFIVAAGGGGGGADGTNVGAAGGSGGTADRDGRDGGGLGAGTGGGAGTANLGGAPGVSGGEPGGPLSGGDSTGTNDRAGAAGGGVFGGGSGGVGGGAKGATASGGGGGGSSKVPSGATMTTASAVTGSVVFVFQLPDTQAPIVTFELPAPTEATGSQGAVVTYEASATDAVDGPVDVTCTPASGSVFALGVTTVTCQATDSSGNVGSGGGPVTVRDTTPPDLTVPASITEQADGPSGTVVSFATSAADIVGGLGPVTCSPASGSTFAVGATEVSCSVTDGAGNTTTKSFTVTVQDIVKPTLTLPANQVVEATGPTGASVDYVVSASDDASPPVVVDCSPPPSSILGLGTTTVACTATDASGNQTTGSFTVTVVDTTAPVLTLPSAITVPATSSSGAVVTYAASASDLVDGSVPVSCSHGSGSVFAAGTTTVTCTATDAHGNSTTGSFTVTVQAADLRVTVTGPATVNRGASAGYVVTVTNLGPTAATNLRTVLALSGLTVTTTVPASVSGSVKVQSQTYTGALWTTPSLAAGASVTYTLTGTVTAKKGDAVLAQTATTSDVLDPATANNTAKATSTVTR